MINEYVNMNVHFIGIGGAGMTPLAIHTKLCGNEVTGSDLNDQNFAQLEREGIFPYKGHNEIKEGTDLVIYSAAVREDNPELVSARSKDIKSVKRAEFLGQITKDRDCILIAGSHGKSTTSVMLSDMTNELEPFFSSAIIGGESVRTKSNYSRGTGNSMILEADE